MYFDLPKTLNQLGFLLVNKSDTVNRSYCILTHIKDRLGYRLKFVDLLKFMVFLDYQMLLVIILN